jgi:phosphocarrier protein HPr
MRTEPKVTDTNSVVEGRATADVLTKLVRLATEGKPSFRDLAVAAGLDPRRDFVGCSLRDLDFRDENLSGFDFSDSDLTGCDFRRANISGVRFTRADFSGAIGIPDDLRRIASEEPAGATGAVERTSGSANAQALTADASRIVCGLAITNRRGLDAEPAARFVQMVEHFDAEVRVTRGDETVGGTSIMGLMMLSAPPGTMIVVEATGGDAAKVIEALDELVTVHFKERW